MKKCLFVVLAVIMLAAGLFTGCASSNSSESDDYYAETKAAEVYPEEPMDMAAADDVGGMDFDTEEPQADYDEYDEQATEDGVGGTNLGMDDSTSILEPDAERKIIYSGYVDARTKQFEEDYQKILNQVDQAKGFVENAYVYGVEPEDWRDEGRRAEITVRVPSKQFDAFMDMLGGLGETMSTQVSGEDVTLRYFDIENRLETLRIQQDRLQELLKTAQNTEDITELYRELRDVEYQIQSFEQEKRTFDSLIDYSQISITLVEVNEIVERAKPDQTIGERIKSGFFSVLNGLADFFEWLLVAVIAISPVLVVLAVIAVIVIILVKRRRKKKQGNAYKREDNKDEK